MHTPPNKFSTLVRVGFAARAVLYMMLGYIGLTSARHLQQGTDGIFVAIRELPLGMALLWLMVLGFTFYGLFRLASAAFDIEQHGSEPRAHRHPGRPRRVRPWAPGPGHDRLWLCHL